MKIFISAICVSAVVLALPQAPAEGATASWHIPVMLQVPVGFDRIQLRMAYPYHFANPTMDTFFGPAPGSEDWTQVFFNESMQVAVATGPNPGAQNLYCTIWINGDRLVDRPTFNLQAYLGGLLVDNADFTCYGPGETNWIIALGTWTLTRPIPPVLAGDANLDGKVRFNDYQMLEAAFGQSGMAWAQGDFNGDGWVRFSDYQALEANFGKNLPEPGTVCLLIAGLQVLLRHRRTKR